MNCKSMNNNCWSFALVIISSVLHVTLCCRGGRVLKHGVTEEEKRLILEEHNFLRQTVATGHVPGQPAAQNMQEMRWDDELAAKAQQWANECTFQHDPSRYLGRFIMGQNLGILWSTAPLADDDGNFPQRIRNWFNEVQKYAWGAKWSVKTGHYSQLVWGDTNLVGCGFSYYQNSRYNKLYVCNGNVVGSKPYATGMPKCQNFGMSDSAKYPGLCKPFENVNNEYSELAFNSINAQQNPSNYYTYKTYNSEYDGTKMVGTSSSTRNNVKAPFAPQSQRNYSTSSNNEVHSFKRQEAKTTNQQQYGNQRSYQPNSQLRFQQLNRYQTSPFQQAFTAAIQQQQQQKRPIDRNNPFHTYRWDLLFKNYL
ncbi:CLUMA_CG000808, isoform A [Clunio marinus]|uniref:CLUMA_CG000808, isoform A n=1 Tax=Clunio marinus TaxID=568069 RepID=A0A1J1HGJ4_9DIPT|nr:CLUMA_CG000808, isoform A [Clunio marinus]